MGVCDLGQSLSQLNNKHTPQHLVKDLSTVGLQITLTFIINISDDYFSDSVNC